MDPNLTGKPIPTASHHSSDRTHTHHIHHRRAQSETFFRFPEDDGDDILLEDVVADFNFAGIDLPSLSSDAPGYSSSKSEGESSEVNAGRSPASRPPETVNRTRSLSVDGDFFNGVLGFSPIDGSNASSFEGVSMVDNTKKPLAPDKLAELSLIDPKRAKRILANRQSAARSKERKIKYTSELERKVQTLQNEATALSTQVTILQRDTTGLTSENKELMLRLQAMEQQAKLRDALNETLREEVQRLKIETGQTQPLNGTNYNRSLPPQHSSHPQMFHNFTNPNTLQPPQQLQHGRTPDSTTNLPSWTLTDWLP